MFSKSTRATRFPHAPGWRIGMLLAILAGAAFSLSTAGAQTAPDVSDPALTACDHTLLERIAVQGLNPVFYSPPALPFANALIPSMGFATNDMAAAIDPTVGNFMNLYGIPGGAVAITYKDNLIFAKSYGYINATSSAFAEPDSRFRLASVSKPITAMGILKLVHDGDLKLSDNPFPFSGVGQVIAGTPGNLFYGGQCTVNNPNCNGQLSDITVDDLLHHAGGWNRNIAPDLTGYDVLQSVESFLQEFSATPIGPPDCTALLAYVESQPLQFAPGTETHYSNIGFCALSELIAETSGLSYIDYLNTNVLSPLGMNDTTMGSTPQSERQDRESFYYDTYPTSGPNSDPPLPSLFPPYGAVPRPYGNVGALEALEGAGGLVSTAIDLAHFAGAIASGKLPNLNEPHQTLPIACSSGVPATTGWPVLFYTDTTKLPSYENAGETVWEAGDWPFGMGWDSVPVAFSSPSSALLCYDNYNLIKDGGYPGTVSSLSVTADGYGFAAVFNQNDNNVPAPQDLIFWPDCASGTPPLPASSANNCALQAAYNHTAVQAWADVHFNTKFAQTYTSWMNATSFASYLSSQKALGNYPSRLEGRAVTVSSPPATVYQYRARFASDATAPNYVYGQSCSAVLPAIQAAPANTPLVSLQRFTDPTTSASVYQAVWSPPVTQLP